MKSTRRLQCFSVAGILACLLASHAFAAAGEAPDLAFGAYQRGHYRDAFSEATKRVEQDHNDAAAMALLGELTGDGLGVAPDLKKAAEWFAQGIAPPEAARRLRISLNSAYVWRRRWRAGGKAALASERLSAAIATLLMRSA